jgi:hypothetical protein
VCNQFVAEDYGWLHISSLSGDLLVRVLTHGSRLRPLSLLLGWLGYRFWGQSLWAWRIFSLSLHAVCSLEVFFLAKLLLRRNDLAFFAALLFCVYPRHHETVLWLAANQFLLGAAWTVLALILHVFYLRTGRLVFCVTMWLSAIIALAANESSVIVFPLLFLTEVLVDSGPSEPFGRFLFSPRRYVKYLPLLPILVVFLAFTFGGDRAFALRPEEVDPRSRMETYHFVGFNQDLVKSFASYLVYVLLPQIPLRVLELNPYSIGLSLAVGSGLVAIFVFAGKFERYCILWMTGALLPYLLFVPFGNADRYFYLAAVGYALLVTAMVQRLTAFLTSHLGNMARIAAIFALLLYLISSAAIIQVRIGEWHRAGEMAQDIISQIVELSPDMPARSTLFVVGLPKHYGQAHVLGAGVGGAMRLAYEETYLVVYHSVDQELIQWLSVQSEGERTPDHHVFLYDEGVVSDVSARVADFEAFFNSWWWYR